MALTENDIKVLTKALQYVNEEEKKIIKNILEKGVDKVKNILYNKYIR